MSRSTIRITTAATVLALMVIGASGAAAVQPTQGSPTPQARSAGIDRHGEAEMGWRTKGSASEGGERTTSVPSGVLGIDVSSHQGNVNWPDWYDAGKRFAYAKATEGTGYTNPYFGQQYNGSHEAGLIRGAYHFAVPSSSGGAAQAQYFLDNGGRWSGGGRTLPGAVDLEWNPYGDACYGKTKGEMRSWISAFIDRYEAGAGRPPVIYTSTSWWDTCVGDSSFADRAPLWIARYADSRGPLPADWSYDTFWQYSDNQIDQNRFNGSYSQLKSFAAG